MTTTPSLPRRKPGRPSNAERAARAAQIQAWRAPIRVLPPALPEPGEENLSPPGPVIPGFWVKGQLLNVRLGGPGWRVTVLGEEYDPRYPERCMEFGNGFECQKFVSEWYSRQSPDPRA